MLDQVFGFIDDLIATAARMTGFAPRAYLDIDTVDDDKTIVCRDGALYSQFRITGFDRMLSADTEAGREEIGQHLESQRLALGSFFAMPGHKMQIVWERDATACAVEDDIDDLIQPSRRNARINGLDLDSMFDHAKAKLIETGVVSEAIDLGFWTTPVILSKVERTNANSIRGKAIAAVPLVTDGPRYNSVIEAFRAAHKSLSATFLSALPLHRITQLNCDQIARRMRRALNPAIVSPQWRPVWEPASALMRSPRVGQSPTDFSGIAPAPISDQIAAVRIRLINAQTIQIGRRWYASVTVIVPPHGNDTPDAFLRAIGSKTSFRMAIMLAPRADRGAPAVLRTLLSRFAFGQPHIKRAYADVVGDADEKRVGLQITVTTWVDGDDTPGTLDRLMEQQSRIVRGLNNWGEAQANDFVGHTVRSLFESVPGANRVSTASQALPPLDDMISILPINRIGSPWQAGSLIMRTKDGRLYPFEPLSPLQSSWLNIIIAPMGSGKSVLANAINRATLTSAAQELLPLLSIMDIGEASSGICNLIQSSLPDYRKHEVQFKTLRQSLEDTINVLDPGILGARKPIPNRRNWLARVLKIICSTETDGVFFIPERVDGFLETLIDFAYRYFKPGESGAKVYARGDVPEVDDMLDELGITPMLKHRELWYGVSDMFHALALEDASVSEPKNSTYWRLAVLSHRRAAPTLGDLVELCGESVLAQQFSESVVVSTQESVATYVKQSFLQAIKQYPNLYGYTKVDLNGSIIALNIEQLVPRGVGSSKQTALYYLICMELIAGKFWVQPDDVRALAVQDPIAHSVDENHLCEQMWLPTQYREAIYADAAVMLARSKTLQADEFHRADHPMVHAQFAQAGRESRARKIQITLISQGIVEMPSELVNVSSTIFMGAGTNPDAQLPGRGGAIANVGKILTSTFQLTASAVSALRSMPKPSEQGAHFVLSAKADREGRVAHQVVIVLSAYELWAYTTRAEDKELRNQLYVMMPYAQALALLAARFSSGSADLEIRRRRSDREIGDADVISALAQELAKARK